MIQRWIGRQSPERMIYQQSDTGREKHFAGGLLAHVPALPLVLSPQRVTGFCFLLSYYSGLVSSPHAPRPGGVPPNSARRDKP
jgi:hypothetical protein